MKKQVISLAIAAAFAAPVMAQEAVEVLHWWTSGRSEERRVGKECLE